MRTNSEHHVLICNADLVLNFDARQQVVDLGSVAQGTIEDVDPEHWLPLVRIDSGPNQGQLIRLTSGQIMRRSRL